MRGDLLLPLSYRPNPSLRETRRGGDRGAAPSTGPEEAEDGANVASTKNLVDRAPFKESTLPP
jgi:hypothetical protein